MSLGTIYQCNHVVVDPSPLRACEARRNYESGLSAKPCDVVETHGLSNVKVPRLCPPCHDKKSSLDTQLVRVKSLIADLKKELSESYGKCLSHMDDAGLKSEKKQDDSSSKSEEATTVEPGSAGVDPDEIMEKIDPAEIDPIEEFLRKKKQESDAHLMMISDYR
ncbi:hypothetical protein Daesc_000217 [Daldinia eschscholtzii]|uniref:Uncharacterized protein n=1 Tax=Daldinia eschscholtzii TaxID=292717 RepID=A0AAX6MZ27_9PEZI